MNQGYLGIRSLLIIAYCWVFLIYKFNVSIYSTRHHCCPLSDELLCIWRDLVHYVIMMFDAPFRQCPSQHMDWLILFIIDIIPTRLANRIARISRRHLVNTFSRKYQSGVVVKESFHATESVVCQLANLYIFTYPENQTVCKYVESFLMLNRRGYGEAEDFTVH